ncbi:MAG: DUF503 domain-containing protein [Chloroflexi bacterium]|nr:MAG: DUF503 domain-containing protein [Chloroflexota bacterium]
MSNSIVGLCTIELYLPGMSSLKDKRRILKSLLTRMRNTFNVAAAEVGHQDKWQVALISFTTVSNSAAYTQRVLEDVLRWIDGAFPDIQVMSEEIDLL